MEEPPFFSEVEEKPNVVKLEEPSDYEEKPMVDPEDFCNSTEGPSKKRPVATCPLKIRTHIHRSEEWPSSQKSLRPRCHTCEMVFPFWAGLAYHETVFKGKPHSFCQPCNRPILEEDHQMHMEMHHLRATKNRPAPMPQIYFRINQPVPEKPEMQAWEKAAGAQRAEDILLGITPGCSKQKDDAPVNRAKTVKIVTTGSIKTNQEVVFPRLFYKEEDEVPFGPKHRCPCPVRECGSGFLVFPHLTEHMSLQHPGLKPIWCHLCPACFGHPDRFKTHLERIHNRPKLLQDREGHVCEDCGRHFVKEEPYYNHRVKWQGIAHAFCCLLEMKAEDLEEHLNSAAHARPAKDPEPVPCEECGRDFTTWFGCKSHAEVFGGTVHYYCNACNMTIPGGEWERHRKLREHRAKMLHVAREEPMTCEDCGSKFRTTLAYGRHCDRYKGRQHFYCRPCKKAGLGEGTEHRETNGHKIKTGEMEDPLTRWRCPVPACGIGYHLQKLLLDHMSVHPGELPFWCKTCPEKFPTTDSLKLHMIDIHNSRL